VGTGERKTKPTQEGWALGVLVVIGKEAGSEPKRKGRRVLPLPSHMSQTNGGRESRGGKMAGKVYGHICPR